MHDVIFIASKTETQVLLFFSLLWFNTRETSSNGCATSTIPQPPINSLGAAAGPPERCVEIAHLNS